MINREDYNLSSTNIVIKNKNFYTHNDADFFIRETFERSNPRTTWTKINGHNVSHIGANYFHKTKQADITAEHRLTQELLDKFPKWRSINTTKSYLYVILPFYESMDTDICKYSVRCVVR